MDILFVSSILAPDIGGPASYVPAMAGALLERGHRVRVLTTSEPEHLRYDDSRHPFPVVRMNRRLPVWQRSRQYLDQIRQWGRCADVIYSNGVFEEAALAGRRLGRPLVMKIVGDEAWERSARRGWTRDTIDEFQSRAQGWRPEVLKRVRSWYARQADQIIVPSGYLKRIVAGWGVPEERIVVVYNAVDAGESTSRPAARPQPAAQRPVRLLTVVRLVPWKGVDRLIRVLPGLSGAELTVVGEGPLLGQLQALAARHRVADRVQFAGSQSRDAVRSLMESHDLFVLASTYEGLPHVVLEAMKHGLPVVATRVGGTPEVVQDGVNGLLAEPEDRSLGLALRRLIDDPALRQRLVREAAQNLGATFNADTMVRQTEAVLCDSAEGRTDWRKAA